MELHTKILTQPDKTLLNKKHFRTPSSSSDDVVGARRAHYQTGLRLGQDVEEAQGTMIMQTMNSLSLLHRPEQVAVETMTMMITMTQRMIGLRLPLEEVESRPRDVNLQTPRKIETTLLRMLDTHCMIRSRY